MIKAGIIGATGYAGSELLRLLKAHPHVEIASITSQSYCGKIYGDIFENFRHENLICESENIDELSDLCDVVFLALPHGIASSKVNERILEKAKIIDLGADFRLRNIKTYYKWYETEHNAVNLLRESVYGLCEIHRDRIKNARLIANPGCYTTCSILALYPLLKQNVINPKSIIIDAKSGVSGAGRSVGLGVHYCETNENIKAYKIATHRHSPEIEEQLSSAAGEEISLLFTPHLVPMNRGILSTCYAELNKNYTYSDIKEIYEKFYGNEHFIRLTKAGVLPETKWVKGSNFTDIGFVIDERTNRIIVVSALDNVVKGAAGQAVQNMNLLFGIDERIGLDNIGAFPI